MIRLLVCSRFCALEQIVIGEVIVRDIHSRIAFLFFVGSRPVGRANGFFLVAQVFDMISESNVIYIMGSKWRFDARKAR